MPSPLLKPSLKRLFATVSKIPFTMAAPKVILAPMVRTSELPTRLLALKYGADVVYGPEIVDKAIIGARRVVNARAGTVDFVKGGGGARGEEKVIFRTHVAGEGGKTVFQMGTANAELAVEAARVVAGDVGGVDVNSGCPKHFSIHSGMGAALLSAPDILTSILTSLVTHIGTPHSIPISVKIRLLDPPPTTIPLVRLLCTTGISRLTVHCRTIPMRPRDPADRTVLSEIADVCRAAGVEVIANGDVESRAHALELCKEYGVDGCMIARAAETNMSVFRPEGPLPWREMAEEFVKTALRVESHFSNTKFCLGRIIPGKDKLYQEVAKAKTHEQVCEALGLKYEPLVAEEEKEKVGTKAVEKAKSGSETVRAAGGAGGVRKGKKLAERGVGSTANAAAAAAIEREDRIALIEKRVAAMV